MRRATLGALAALEGRDNVAAEQWSEALRLADGLMPEGIAHPLGEERARLAYDEFTRVGARQPGVVPGRRAGTRRGSSTARLGPISRYEESLLPAR